MGATINCPPTGCSKEYPLGGIINITSISRTQETSTDCTRNVLYITDNPGYVATDTDDYTLWDNVTVYDEGQPALGSDGRVYTSLIDNNVNLDPTLNAAQWKGTYLDATQNGRLQIVSSFSQIQDHFVNCESGVFQSAYYDSQLAFLQETATGSSPGFFVMAYWDRDNETIAEALDAIYECFKCFEWVVPMTTLNDGTDFEASGLTQSLVEWSILNDQKLPSFFTIDPATKTSFTETTSEPAITGKVDKNYKYAHFIYASEKCRIGVDGTCEETGTEEAYIQASPLTYALANASFSTSSPTYIPDTYWSSRSNTTTLSTSNLTVDELTNVTGTLKKAQGQFEEATRYINAFSNFGGKKGYVYANGITGFATYELLQSKYIYRDMQNTISDYIYNSTNRSITENNLNVLDNLLLNNIYNYRGKGIISADETSFDLPEGYSLIAEDNGFILARQNLADLSLTQLSQGFSPQYYFCYISARQLRFFDLTICALLRPEQLTTVL